jgi:hypothetical protein
LVSLARYAAASIMCSLLDELPSLRGRNDIAKRCSPLGREP